MRQMGLNNAGDSQASSGLLCWPCFKTLLAANWEGEGLPATWPWMDLGSNMDLGCPTPGTSCFPGLLVQPPASEQTGCRTPALDVR